MSYMSAPEQVDSLNKILAIIDDKATLYKDERFDMPAVRKNAEQKMILDLVDNALDLCNRMDPVPNDVITDLKKLQKDLFAF